MSNIWIGFKRKEFECKCGCGFATVDAELLEVLKDLRVFFGNNPVYINSACRCEEHNANVGGAPKRAGIRSSGSKHMYGIAADIRVKGFTPDSVAEYLETTYPDKYGIGRYNTFTHIDVRPVSARWDRRSN
ncbi:peptidase M15 family protein [Vibrio phage KIT04]|nr:peptidase M15 family protein [Vibrio phage KIT04]